MKYGDTRPQPQPCWEQGSREYTVRKPWRISIAAFRLLRPKRKPHSDFSSPTPKAPSWILFSRTWMWRIHNQSGGLHSHLCGHTRRLLRTESPGGGGSSVQHSCQGGIQEAFIHCARMPWADMRFRGILIHSRTSGYSESY